MKHKFRAVFLVEKIIRQLNDLNQNDLTVSNIRIDLKELQEKINN